MNMHPWSAACRNYLQAIPCDPAGAHFNFAALSFNSEFLHQIHLIPLHGYSPAEKQALCTLSAAEKCCQRLERETLSRVEGNWNDPYHNFPSRLPGDVLWFTTVSHSTHTGYITPTPTNLQTLSLSLHWLPVIWRVKKPCLCSITSVNKHAKLCLKQYWQCVNPTVPLVLHLYQLANYLSYFCNRQFIFNCL